MRTDVGEVAEKKVGGALVLVHGFRGAPEGMEEVARRLRARGYEVLVPAIPPTGTELIKYTPEVYAEFLAKYIREQKLEQPVLVGHSMGSIVVAAMAEKHPELIADKLILMAPIVKHPPRFVIALAPLTSYLPNWLISRVTTRYLFAGKGKKLYQKCLALTLKCGAKSGRAKEQRQAARFSCQYGVADFRLKQKALCVIGEKDRLTRVGEVQTEAKKVGGEVKILSGCGHLLNYECPGRVAVAIDEFLQK